jgi:hypothetical protein
VPTLLETDPTQTQVPTQPASEPTQTGWFSQAYPLSQIEYVIPLTIRHTSPECATFSSIS